MIEFWRNESTLSFDPDAKASTQITEVLDKVKATKMGKGAEALVNFLRIMSLYLDPRQEPSMASDRLLLQEYTLKTNVIDIRFIIRGMEKQILGAIVGGGIRLWIVWEDESIKAELSAYYHRLVCTNGMIRKTETAGWFEAQSLEEWVKQVENGLPSVMSCISAGLDTFYRSARIRLGILVPVIPVILEYMDVQQPYRKLITDSFDAEPGDTLWHLVNAFSRAANLVMKASGVPPDEADQKRIQLQRASVNICEKVLEDFEQGKSIFEIAENIKKITE
ncbi:MAG: hypothetical protein LBF85_10885 [Tannerella sp.]|nr:hypothetical protein [Tannerella sp.]